MRSRSWDPSVKALTAFPQVLDQMAQNLAWTTDLGNAYYNQPQDVMQTIQVMRARAQEAGNLQTTPQQEVIEDQGNIQIAPPTPQVVYVPQYDPWAVYGAPVAPYPGFHFFGAIGAGIDATLSWGPAIALDAVAYPFSWLGWGLDWFAHAIFFGGDVWCTHSGSVRDWGYAHGGGRYWGTHGELARYGGGWGGQRGGWQQHTFRSGLDRGNFPHATHPSQHALGGGSRGFGYLGNSGNRNGGYGGGYGSTFGRSNPGGGSIYNHGNGYQSSGNTYGGYGQRAMAATGLAARTGASTGATTAMASRMGDRDLEAISRGPQATGRPQPYGGAQPYGQGRSGGYAGRQQAYAGASGSFGHQNYGVRPGFGGGNSQSYRCPATAVGTARMPTAALPVAGTADRGDMAGLAATWAYGGSAAMDSPELRRAVVRIFLAEVAVPAPIVLAEEAIEAPKAPSFSGGGGHSFFGGGGGGSLKLQSAPHFSSNSGGAAVTSVEVAEATLAAEVTPAAVAIRAAGTPEVAAGATDPNLLKPGPQRRRL